jgi:hypothetical protein
MLGVSSAPMSVECSFSMTLLHGLRPKWEGAPFDYRADAAFEGVAAS